MTSIASDADGSRSPFAVRVGPWLWGAFVAWALTRSFFHYAPGEMHENHEGYTYVYRALEFMDALAAGYWSPQWATHFRGGLGGPYFGYYQPGFFYAVAAAGSVLPLMTALAAAVWAYALVGWGGIFVLVRDRFGTAAGMLAATAFLGATWVHTEIYKRGDLSEFAGMTVLAATLAALVGFLEDGGRWRWVALAVGAGVVVVCHPVAGLLGYATLAGTIVVWAMSARSVPRPLGAALALVAGVGLAAFYWMPILLEWHHARGAYATMGAYSVTKHFVRPLAFVGLAKSRVPVAFGWTAASLTCLATVVLAWRWRQLAACQRRLATVLWALAVVSTILATELSRPVWTTLPLVGLVQFPWRTLLVQAIALSALAGCLPGVPRGLLVVGAVALAFSLAGSPGERVKRFDHVETAAELERLMVKPDAVGEWLPATARPIDTPPEPTITMGTIDQFERRTGYLRARVDATGPAVVTLPHYWFAVGWDATFFGRYIRLSPGPDGLMTARLLGKGVLEARFRTTPARRAGLVVSGATAVLLVAGALFWKRRRAP